MAPEETTTQTSLIRSGWPRPSAPQKHSTAKQPSLSARNYDPILPATTNLGAMSVQCASCEAKRWIREPASLCCCHGKVKLKPLGMPPEPLKTLYLGETSASKHFLQHTRRYNCAFNMTSFGCHEVRESESNPSFKIQGQICHKMGSLCPLPNEDPKFTQIYFVDNYDVQATYRLQHIPGLQKQIILDLQKQIILDLQKQIILDLQKQIILDLQSMLHTCNSYVQSFNTALEFKGTDDTFKLVINADQRPAGQHERRNNAPLCNEVAVLLFGEEHDKRDIVLRISDNNLARVSETHGGCATMALPHRRGVAIVGAPEQGSPPKAGIHASIYIYIYIYIYTM